MTCLVHSLKTLGQCFLATLVVGLQNRDNSFRVCAGNRKQHTVSYKQALDEETEFACSTEAE